MSMKIDIMKCTGCGTCARVCPQNAISIRGGLAFLEQYLCVDCGKCVPACPAGAIYQETPVKISQLKGGERMFGYGRGFGFRGSSPPWPYVGRGRGGMPRRWHPGPYGWGGAYMTPGIFAYPPSPAPGDELVALKDQAAAVKEHLDWINARINDLEKSE